eukprot:PITA_22337
MNVYGPRRLDDKIRFLDSLVNFRVRYARLPSVIEGDFNMIRSLLEKKGGTRALIKDVAAFQIFSENMKLIDIETNNGLCTWNNKRGGNSQVASKLDRFMISEDLMLLDKEIMAEILPFSGSDHWPVLMEIKGIGTPRNRPFRFQKICGIAREDTLVREPFIKDITNHIPKLVTKEDNDNLNRRVTENEVSEVLKEMQDGKALGSDGFNVDFFKFCWNIVKEDIVRVVEDSKLHRTILKALNTSFITLIPK